MSYENHGPDVAKNGGESAPYFRNMLEQDQRSENHAPIMVISAPGITEDWPVKFTTMMLDGGGFDVVRDRFTELVKGFDPDGDYAGVQKLMDQLPEEFERWERQDNPTDAFGEYWTARLYAAYSRREFVDAAEVILLDDQGGIDFDSSAAAIRERFQQSRQYYIVPGYYGRRPDGSIATLGRNSSDTTGAVIAAALQSRRYYKHIKEGGFLTAPPGIALNSFIRDCLTYRELRELSLGGYEVLAAGAFKYLPLSGVETVICSNAGPRIPGTVVNDTRDCGGSPIAAVTGRDDIINVPLGHTGMNDEVGATRPLIDMLDEAGIPYSTSTSSTDEFALQIMGRELSELEGIAERVREQTGDIVDLRSRGSVHVVGEGIADHQPLRLKVIGKVAMALGSSDIKGYGMLDNGNSPGFSVLVDPRLLKNGESNPLQITHDVLLPYLGAESVMA